MIDLEIITDFSQSEGCWFIEVPFSFQMVVVQVFMFGFIMASPVAKVEEHNWL